MRPIWLNKLVWFIKFALSALIFCAFFASKEHTHVFNCTTAGDRDCVAAVKRLHALHYSVDLMILSFGINVSIFEI